MGYTGRKGPKSNPTIMGSTVKTTTVRVKCPVIIVIFINTRPILQTKYFYKSIPEDYTGYKFLICLDGSIQSKKAYNYVKDLYDPELDEVYGACVSGGKYCGCDQAGEIQ